MIKILFNVSILSVILGMIEFYIGAAAADSNNDKYWIFLILSILLFIMSIISFNLAKNEEQHQIEEEQRRLKKQNRQILSDFEKLLIEFDYFKYYNNIK